MITTIEVAELDFRQVTRNLSVQTQGILTCINTPKGWFSLTLGKFPSRQDLAIVIDRRVVDIIGADNAT